MLHNQIAESKRFKDLHGKLKDELKILVGEKKTIEKIILNSNKLTNIDILELIEVAKTLPSLKEIDLSYNELGGEVDNIWILPLLFDLSIQRLVLKENPLDLQDADKIVDRAIKTGRKLELEIHPSTKMNMVSFQKIKTKAQKTNLTITDPKVKTGDDLLERKDQELPGEGLRRVIKRLHSTQMKSLKLARCNLGDKDIKELGDAILATQIHYLEELDLSENNISPASCDTLCLLLKTCRVLRRLDLHKNHLEDKGVVQIAKEISSSSTLQYINVAENQFGLEGIAAINGAIKDRSGFEAVGLPGDLVVADQDLSKEKLNMLLLRLAKFPFRKIKIINCRIGDEEIKLIGQVIEKYQAHYLEKIDFSQNEITDGGLQTLAQLTPKCLKLRSVLLAGNHISLADVNAAANLDLMKSWTRLDLSSNAINDIGAQAVLEKLLPSKSMQILDLRNNKMSPGYVLIFILQAGNKKIGLANNLPLRFLNCSNLNLNDTELARILRMLAEERLWQDLEKIDFSGNKLTDYAFNLISSFATRCPKLSALDLKRNLITFENVGEAKRDCFYHIKELDLAANKILEKGGMALADKIEKTTSLKLKKLLLNGNQIPFNALQAIEKAVTKSTLDKVDLSSNGTIVVNESDSPEVTVTLAPSMFRRDRQSPVQFFDVKEDHFVPKPQ